MIKRSVAERIFEAALQEGADFAEIFLEDTKETTISMVNGKVEHALSGIRYGVGIRLFQGNRGIYAYTNDMEESNLIQIAKEAGRAAKGQGKHRVLNFDVKEIPTRNPILRMPNTVEHKEKVEQLRRGMEAARAYDTKITQTKAGYLDVVQNVFIANTQGTWVTDERVRTRFTIEAVASSATEKQSGRFGPGGSVGFELFHQIDVEEYGREAARIAVTMLGAGVCPSGKMPVVIDNGFGGVIFHEACGHGLEATAVARNASVFAGKLGKKIASDIVTAVDDGTIPNAWGSSAVDDEGTPTQKNILIENGVLKSYLVDKLNGRKMGMASTGSARRQNYRYAPTSRMTNTYIASGKSTPQDIISNTEYGLYAKQMGGGSVDPATGIFNFAVLEGYMIRNGKIAEPVRGATLIGKGAEVLMRIDMVGNNIRQAQGMCGSISGSIPTNVGQPMIRVGELTVGGRG